MMTEDGVEQLISGLAGLFVICALTAVVPTIAYLMSRKAGMSSWPLVQGPPEVLGEGSYRASYVPTHMHADAPPFVRATAFISLYLGQMFVPGLLLGVAALFVDGIGLVSIPGLVIAFRSFQDGVGLLRNTPGIVERARATARWSAALNIAVFAVATLFVVLGNDIAYVAWFTGAYAMVSLAHAWMLNAAADQVAALNRNAERPGAEPAFAPFPASV